MLKVRDLARQEDHRVRGGQKGGKPDEIGGYHTYDFDRSIELPQTTFGE